MRILRAAILYFLAVFAAGCVLGPIRVLVLAPRIGAFRAVLCEAPFLIAAMVLAARWVGRCIPLATVSQRAAMGAAALALTLSAEIAGAIWLRDLTVTGAFAELGAPEGVLSLGLFALFAVLPALNAPPRPTASARG